MKNHISWAEALQISPDQLSEWRSLAPDEVPLVYWAVDQGHLDADIYLHWAKEHFQLPVVHDEYFASVTQLPKTEGSWSPWLIPINEWEGVLYVACMEPPPAQEWPQAVRFVLASPDALRRAVELRSENFASEDADLAKTEIVSTEPRKTKVSLQLDFDSPLGAPEIALPEPPPQVAPDAPSTHGKPLLNFGDEVELSVVRPGPSAATPPPARPPSASLNEPVPLAAPANLPAAPASWEDAQSLEEAVSWSFAQLSAHYSHCMVLRESQNQVVPWLWSSNWATPQQSITKINSLDQPSLFRIAIKTRHPYHGFVVTNELHSEFFKNWGFDGLPSCATAVPVLIHQRIWGLLLCVGDESSESPEALRQAEQIAEKISGFLEAKKNVA